MSTNLALFFTRAIIPLGTTEKKKNKTIQPAWETQIGNYRVCLWVHVMDCMTLVGSRTLNLMANR